jgi:hypothetical protein
MGITFRSAPEYKSVPDFVQFCLDMDSLEFTHEDMHALAYRTRRPYQAIRLELEGYGLRLAVREIPKYVRGFGSCDNDRWFGPGSMKTHGGSGFSNFE